LKSIRSKRRAEPRRSGEGMVVADLDLALITKRKRMIHQEQAAGRAARIVPPQ